MTEREGEKERDHVRKWELNSVINVGRCGARYRKCSWKCILAVVILAAAISPFPAATWKTSDRTVYIRHVENGWIIDADRIETSGLKWNFRQAAGRTRWDEITTERIKVTFISHGYENVMIDLRPNFGSILIEFRPTPNPTHFFVELERINGKYRDICYAL